MADFMYERHLEKIALGAKFRLMRMAGTKWSNPKQAGAYGQLFYRECANVKSQVTRGLAQTQTYLQAPKFA